MAFRRLITWTVDYMRILSKTLVLGKVELILLALGDPKNERECWHQTKPTVDTVRAVTMSVTL